MEEAAKEVVSK